MQPIPIVNGMIENISYHDHKRAKNWIAVVQEDKSKPGGLERVFLDKGAHGWCRVSQDVQPGRYLEFAGDHVTMSNKRKENRLYRHILDVTPHSILVEFCTFDHVGHWEEVKVGEYAQDNPLAALSDKQLLQQMVNIKQELVRRNLTMAIKG